MSFDSHSVRNLCVAGSDRTGATVQPHDAQATTAIRLHPIVVTNRRDFNLKRTQRLENGEPLFESMQLPVDRYLKQGSNSSA